MPRFSRCSSLPVLLALSLIPDSALAQSYPFEGAWDCGIGTFHFTAARYDTGEGEMEILDIAGIGDTYTLTFEDDYQLSLAMNPDGTMHWFSPVSGDGFDCRPLD